MLDSSIEYLKGVGPAKADLLKKELAIKSFEDLLNHFPFRYVDRSSFQKISEIYKDGETVQLKGTIYNVESVKGKFKKRLNATLKDSSGFVELTWFQGIKWIEKIIQPGKEYIVFGRISKFKGKKTIVHPEIEIYDPSKSKLKAKFAPVYHSTEKLTSRGLDAKGIRRLYNPLFEKISKRDIPENLPSYILEKTRLCSRWDAYQWIHLPPSETHIAAARNRLKFEELFFLQLRLLHGKYERKRTIKGIVFEKIGDFFNRFFHEKLCFELTGAQKRVLKEIRYDLGAGIQMNRLLQGDVGSGKTIVGLMSMLIAIDNGYQACMMAPTEILAQQHYQSITASISGLGLRVGFLSGSVKGNKRKELLKLLALGEIHILIGTHALIEDWVIFKNLGLSITDEQHRFGVKQRAKLWAKNISAPPHILVMTATPIPRTLAMTVYGELDVSVIDELPPGRKEIKTIHKSENARAAVIQFMHKQIALGRQIYVVFPLIEESEKLDLQNLQTGYETLLQFFPQPDFQISVVHGRMKQKDKDFEMDRFVRNKTQVMVATTVIEVGVNVPNASVMIIENTERFGLSQLHQLRGRVGRGADQSFCVLMTSYKLTKEARKRIETMVQTNDGFKIAEVDMELRGHGDIEGTQQSGIMDFKIANLFEDQVILRTARHMVNSILDEDPLLEDPKNIRIKNQLSVILTKYKSWGRIA
jgi:ATP-dependent DNA helicase RecG